MQNQPEKKSSSTPIIIIVAVLIAAGVFGWYFYSSSQNDNANTAASNTAARNTSGSATTASPTRSAPTPAVNAPTGAPLGVNMTGSPTAAVTIEEFADYQCGACAQAHPILKEIKGVYGDRIRFIFRNYPLAIPAHDKAYNASVAVEAAGLQGKYWAMQDMLFTNQSAWSASPNFPQLLNEYAQRVGLDVAKFNSDMAAMPSRARVDADLARGKALGVTSTPTIYVNGQLVPYQEVRVDSLRRLIDAELQAAAAKPAAASNSNADTGSNASNAAK